MSSSARLSLAELCNRPLPLPPTTLHPKSSSSSSSSPSSPTSSCAASPSSPMTSPEVLHAGIKRPLAIDDNDEDVRIAARALGDMRSRAVAHARAPSAEAFAAASKAHSRTSSASQSTPFLSPSTTPSTISNSSPQPRQQSLDKDHHVQEMTSSETLSLSLPSNDFVSRVVHSPIVSSVISAYEDSKKRSKVVQIGANLMETSVKTISRPVINRLPVNQLDEFACRQLDRIYPLRSAPSSPDAVDTPKINNDNHNNSHFYTAYRDPVPLESGASSRAPSVAPDDYSASNSPILPLQCLLDDPAKKRRARDGDNTAARSPSLQQEIVVKSKWQSMLCEAGGISAAVSQESMKRLQYCLQWLQYATNRIDNQIVVLRSFIDSLTPESPHENDLHALVPLQVMRTLTDVRRDLVKTIREVVKVISIYAGGALPEPARSTVRTFILRLPARWANATGGDISNPPSMPSSPRMQQQQRLPSSENLLAGLNGSLSQIQTQNGGPLPSSSSSSSSSSLSQPHSTRPTAGRATHPTALAATQAAQRVLTLATESLDMMRGVTNVFKESLERADAWVERLRIAGIQRHDGGGAGASTSTNTNHLHMPSMPSAGPRNGSNPQPYNSSAASSTILIARSPEQLVSSPRSRSPAGDGEIDTHVVYSSASGVRSLMSSSSSLSLGTSASASTSNGTTVLKRRRKQRTKDHEIEIDAINLSAVNENGYRRARRARSHDHISMGDIQSARRHRRRFQRDSDDETETEDAGSYRSSGSARRHSKEKADEDDISPSANGVNEDTNANGDNDYHDDNEDDNDDNGYDNDNDNDSHSPDRASMGLRRGNGTGSTDADDCSDASFYSAKTRSMEID